MRQVSALRSSWLATKSFHHRNDRVQHQDHLADGESEHRAQPVGLDQESRQQRERRDGTESHGGVECKGGLARVLVGDHDALLDRLVSAVVTETFQLCGSNQIKTAAALGVTRNVVRTHLKNYGLI